MSHHRQRSCDGEVGVEASVAPRNITQNRSRPRVWFITTICRDYRVKAFETLAARLSTRFFFFSKGDESYQRGVAHHHGKFQQTRLIGFAIMPKFRACPGLIARLLMGRYDLVIKCINGRFALPISYLCARVRRKPFILWTGLWMVPRTVVHRSLAFIVRHIYHNADAIVGYGPHVKEFLISQGVKSERIFLAPQAQDNDFFSAPIPMQDIERFRRQHRITTNAIALFVGRIEREKGVEVLAHAWRKLVAIDVTLLVVGDGPLLQAVRSIMQEGVNPIVVVGPLDRCALRVVYAASDVLILPSITTDTFKEPWGFVINEAMAQNMAIIASDAVGAARSGLVIDGENGLVIPERDVDRLAGAIQSTFLDRRRLQAMKAASAKIVAKYTVERMIEGFEQAVRYCLRA